VVQIHADEDGNRVVGANNRMARGHPVKPGNWGRSRYTMKNCNRQAQTGGQYDDRRTITS
jgi:hypothetical protein